jgi:putative membrane protein
MNDTRLRFFLLFAGVHLICSCGNRNPSTDPVRAANDINSVKIDSTKKDTAAQMAATAIPVSVNPDDAKFLVNAANDGLLEIDLGEVAQQQGTENRVKRFGSMMISDHTAATAELKQLAAKKNISLPAALSGEALKQKASISGKEGTAFDNAYLELMLKKHKSAVQAFEREISKGSDPDIRDFASRTLHIIKGHLDSADNFRHLLVK